MLSPEGLEKTYIAFSNKTFPIVDIINVCHFIYEELDLLNFDLWRGNIMSKKPRLVRVNGYNLSIL